MLMRRMATAAFAAFLVFGGLATEVQAQVGDPSFNLVNRSGRVIYEAYASPASQNTWGVDRLGQNVVQPGRSFLVRLPFGECIYDVRVVYDRQGGPAEERRNINLCNVTELVFDGRQVQRGGGGKPLAPQQAGPTGNPSFNLVNQGQQTVMQLFASPTTESDWGPDRLGADTVSPGEVFAVRLPEGPCMYDIRIVYDNAPAQERRNVNLCDVVNLIVPLQ